MHAPLCSVACPNDRFPLSTFFTPSGQMWTKLRPAVRDFLQRASSLFQLWIHTNGGGRSAGRRLALECSC